MSEDVLGLQEMGIGVRWPCFTDEACEYLALLCVHRIKFLMQKHTKHLHLHIWYGPRLVWDGGFAVASAAVSARPTVFRPSFFLGDTRLKDSTAARVLHAMACLPRHSSARCEALTYYGYLAGGALFGKRKVQEVFSLLNASVLFCCLSLSICN